MPKIKYLIAANIFKIGFIWLTSVSATKSTSIFGFPSIIIVNFPKTSFFLKGASIGLEYSIDDFNN